MKLRRDRFLYAKFWDHLAHLAVRRVDDEGRACRVLDVKHCAACRRLWATLQPSGVTFPAAVATGVSGVYLRADVLDVPVPAAAQRSARRPAGESPAVRRLDEFTNERARAARLEHY